MISLSFSLCICLHVYVCLSVCVFIESFTDNPGDTMAIKIILIVQTFEKSVKKWNALKQTYVFF